MANTYVKIASTTVGAGGAANVEFTSIPTTYTDLKIVFSARSNYASVWDHMYYFLNGDTANNYTSRWLQGSGSAASSSQQGAAASLQPRFAIPGANATASTFGNGEIYIPNYLSSNSKSQSLDTVTENNATEAYAVLTAGLWNNTSAINAFKIYPYFGTVFTQYTTFTIYGIKNS
jgi:hypothetical protein